jgi:LPXTG-site transpeptidase (sortase) family protein
MSLFYAFLIGLIFTLWLAYREWRSPNRWPAGSSSASGPWWWIVPVGIVSLGVLLMTKGVLNPPSAPSVEITATVEIVNTTAIPHPSARMLIPDLGVDEKIVFVPIREGEWDISQLSARIGLLETTGRRPGDNLAMVFIGHVTSSALDRGPFADLWTLKPLAQLIYRSSGTDYVYAVKDLYKVRPDETEKLYLPKGDHILLVTCTDWNYLTETYDTRLIADAVLVQQQPSP